ncbi:MAG: sugar phosphate isomerase/epimerase [Lachnospiraceae bacterium]|nr:sugar phosphate isomerase/epimerase [Lachnospiraceae bacterium]
MLRLGIRFHDTAELPFEERVKAAEGQGFSCVHIALSKIKDIPSDISALTSGYANYLKGCFDKAGLSVAVLGNYLNLCDPDPDRISGILKKYEAHIRFASYLRAGVVGTETGAPNSSYDCSDREAVRSESAYVSFRENVKKVIGYAQHYGVTFAIEPVYKHIIYSPERARRLLDEVASENLRIIFDPVNLLDPDRLDERDEVLQKAMELLSEEIAVIHLKDFIPEKREDGSINMKPCGCGLGVMTYDDIIGFAVRKKPFIEATLENTTPGDATQCRNHIEEIIRKYENAG